MSFTNIPKTGTSFGTPDKLGGQVDFITTDAPDFVLVSSAENEPLIWQERSTWTDINKT